MSMTANGFIIMLSAETGMEVFVKGSAITSMSRATKGESIATNVHEAGGRSYLVKDSPHEILLSISESYKQAGRR